MNNKMKLIILLSGIVLLTIGTYKILEQGASEQTIKTGDKTRGMLQVQTTTPLTENEEPISRMDGIGLNRRDNIVEEEVIQEWEKHHEEIQEWQQTKLGYYLSTIIDSDYDSYDIEALEQLGEQGDLKALDLLAQKYMLLQDLDSAKKTYRKAAAFGSTWALKELGNLEQKIMFEKDVTLEQKELYRGKIELAYYQAAILRGDTIFLLASENYIRTHKLKLTDEDKRYVRKSGVKIYNQLQQERAKRGLSAFDNSMPWFIKDYYNHVGSNYTYLTTGNSPLFVVNKGVTDPTVDKTQ